MFGKGTVWANYHKMLAEVRSVELARRAVANVSASSILGGLGRPSWKWWLCAFEARLEDELARAKP